MSGPWPQPFYIFRVKVLASQFERPDSVDTHFRDASSRSIGKLALLCRDTAQGSLFRANALANALLDESFLPAVQIKLDARNS